MLRQWGRAFYWFSHALLVATTFLFRAHGRAHVVQVGGHQRVGGDAAHRHLHLVHKSGNYLVFAGQQGLVAVFGHLGGVGFRAFGHQLQALHIDLVEEIGVGHARLQEGNGGVDLLHLLAHGFGERRNEGLGAVVHRLQGPQ